MSLEDFINGETSETSTTVTTTSIIVTTLQTPTTSLVHAERIEWITGYYDNDGNWHFFPGYGD